MTIKSMQYMNSSLEASELGLLAGDWPETMIYKDHLFNKSHLEFMPGNELMYVEYLCEMPNKVWTLKIFND